MGSTMVSCCNTYKRNEFLKHITSSVVEENSVGGVGGGAGPSTHTKALKTSVFTQFKTFNGHHKCTTEHLHSTDLGLWCFFV